jgi:hypothetical protein
VPGCVCLVQLEAWYDALTDVLVARQSLQLTPPTADLDAARQVGRLAEKLFNCKVIGSAGSPDKAALVVRDFGFDACIDYRTVSSTEELYGKLKELAPDGIDMYFENVGGMHFEAAFKALRRGGRIAVCGTISGCVLTPVSLFSLDLCMCVLARECGESVRQCHGMGVQSPPRVCRRRRCDEC